MPTTPPTPVATATGTPPREFPPVLGHHHRVTHALANTGMSHLDVLALIGLCLLIAGTLLVLAARRAR